MSADLHSLTGAFALDALDEAERQQFERHLAVCSDCTDEVHGYRETTARLALLAEEPVPASLRGRIMDAAAATPQDRPATVTPMVRPRRSVTATRWLSVAAAALLVTTGAFGVAAYNSDQRVDELSATAASVAAVLAADDAQTVHGTVAGGGSGSVVVSRERAEAVVVASGVGQPPSGTTYQLWAIGQEGAQSRGLITPDSQGAAGDVVPWPEDATALGMTVEPEGGSEQPTSDPVLLLELPT